MKIGKHHGGHKKQPHRRMAREYCRNLILIDIQRGELH